MTNKPGISLNSHANCQALVKLQNLTLICQHLIPCVCEAVRQVPEVAHVVEESDLVDLLHFLPHESEDPEDDDALDRRRERAALLRVPVVHQVVQEFHVKHITKELFRQKKTILKD